MNVIFLTMSSSIKNIRHRGIYNDLMRKFRNEGHNVYIVYPSERRDGRSTELIESDGIHLLNVSTLNLQKTSIIEKGLGQASVEVLYKRAIKRYLSKIKFDLILYSTPPITLAGVVDYVKRKSPQAITYLLLKDIFPQNAVDMGMMSKTGIKGLLYKYFRKKEESLYRVSDYIGCMSPANVKYVLEHNHWIDGQKVEMAPNSIELIEFGNISRKETLQKYGLPIDKPIFIYGGNLGKPQGIPFLMECLEANKFRSDCHFVIVGTGTYYQELSRWYEKNPKTSVTIMEGLPKNDYDCLVRACDVGLVFLDYNFTIPNYPSRLLSYLESKMPIICATDSVCDMGAIAEENHYGFCVPSNNVLAFCAAVDRILKSDIKAMGKNGYDFLKNNYLVNNTYNVIMNHF